MAEGRDAYVSLTDAQKKRAIDFIASKAASTGTIESIDVDDDDYGTYVVSVIFAPSLNEDELESVLAKSLHHKGDKQVQVIAETGQISVFLQGVRADRIGL
jgi:hypothetical protein